MNFPCYFGREACPPVFRVMVAEDLRRAAEQLTLWRGNGEDGAAFYHRAQGAGAALHRRHGFARWVYLECVYQPDPNVDDDRANTRHALLHTINNESDNVDVRLGAIKALNRLQKLVEPSEVW